MSTQNPPEEWGKTNSEFKKIPKAEILSLFGLMKAFKK
jgi:hypothetical protein